MTEDERIEVLAREMWKMYSELTDDDPDEEFVEELTDEEWFTLTVESEREQWRKRAVTVIERAQLPVPTDHKHARTRLFAALDDLVASNDPIRGVTRGSARQAVVAVINVIFPKP